MADRQPRSTSLPRKTWVGTNEVKLTLVPADDPVLADDEPGTFARGVTDCTDPPAIYISRLLSPAQLLEVVWHEMTHVINYLHDIDDSTPEEVVATVHGRVWPLVLLSNPKLQRWINAQVNAIRKEQANA